jgi:hypothetical protein
VVVGVASQRRGAARAAERAAQWRGGAVTRERRETEGEAAAGEWGENEIGS